MTRTRAPGGGRKPRGPFSGKTETFTARITPETRHELAPYLVLVAVGFERHLRVYVQRLRTVG
jgi:hypothetical protein